MVKKTTKVLQNIAVWSILLILTAGIITLPFWNPFLMSFADKVLWWAIFGVVAIYLWVQSFRKV